jgi:hypothetical protein
MRRLSLYLISLSLLVVAGLLGSFLAWTELPGHWRLLATNEFYRDAVALEEFFPDLDVQGLKEMKNRNTGESYGLIILKSVIAEPWDQDVLDDFYLTTIEMMEERFPEMAWWVFVFVNDDGIMMIEIDCPNQVYIVMDDLYKNCNLFPFTTVTRVKPEDAPWPGRYPFAQ